MSSQIVQLDPLGNSRRRNEVRAGVRVEIVTVVWMTVEAVVGIGAGIVAGSVLLIAFGIDSVVELIAGAALLWRLVTEARGNGLERVERAENRAAWITGVGLVALCLYIVISSALSLWSRHHPDASPVGIGLALSAVLVMPILVWQKRKIAQRINSPALRADAACSLTCAYMAGTLLVGLGLSLLVGWWWVDAVAALGLLYWIVPEAREALESAREGQGGCTCEDPPR